MIDWCLIMKYYQDIHILDTEGTKFNQIISRVFTSIHHAITAFLAEHEDTKTTDRIALAFPELAERIEQNSLIIGSIIRVFGKDVELNKAHRGDLIALRSAGAYGEVMASQYNCRHLPKAYYSDTIK